MVEVYLKVGYTFFTAFGAL